ncbi:MAG: hypothetical protein ACAI25_03675 [Planctomycetota bacterium]
MADLFADPKKYLDENMVRVHDVIAGNNDGDIPPAKLDKLEEGIKLYQVKDADKFRSAAVEADSKDPGCKVLKLTKPGTGQQVYYLPWSGNCGYRITLSGVNSVDPDYFVTAGLNGCTVVVDGDPKKPTVYHFNARDTGAKLTATLPEEQAKMDSAVLGKVIDMENRFKVARGSKPVVNPPKSGSARSVNLNHYMGPVISSKKMAEMLADMQKKLKVDPKWKPVMSKSDPKRVYCKPAEISYIGYGTVVGKRQKDGTWQFFCQGRWQASYWQLKSGKGTVSDDWDQKQAWADSETVEFWPKGGGVAL